MKKNTKQPDINSKDLFSKAARQEQEGEVKEAISTYKEILDLSPRKQNVYQRLMILYRKLKDYRKESAIIKKAIKTFEDVYRKPRLKSKSRKVTQLSSRLMQISGLSDKKGNHLHDPEPIAGWKKRLKLVEQRATS